jgi:alpha-1,3-rhamnosyl/mannosyltransferase
VDVFHATDHYIPKLRHTPVVATVHDIIGILHPEWVNPSLRVMKNVVFRKAVGWAEEIITISDYSAADLRTWLGDKAQRITTVPQGVNEVFFNPVADEVKLQTLEKYALQPGFFIVVGTLQPRKNVARIMQAHALLPAEMRRAHPLVVVGKDGWRTEDILPALVQLEEDHMGRWLQYVPRQDLFALLQSAQALVFPSLYEGFGLPVLEAFAARLPVITANTTSLPEVAGDAALLVDPTSVEEISHAMKQLVEQPTLRATLVEKGSVQVQQFSWEQTARRTQRVYQRMSA